MAEQETTKINLSNDVTVNGRTFKAGQNVTVPKDQAEDISRIDYEHTQYKNNLHVGRKYRPVNAGTIAMGGGAE